MRRTSILHRSRDGPQRARRGRDVADRPRRERAPRPARGRGRLRDLGIDPLYVANEGKLIAVVAAEAADEALATIRSHPLGREAVLLGEVRAEPAGLVLLDTALGGTRIVDMLVGDPLPRIC